jgi:CheY-like chemotaxis protein
VRSHPGSGNTFSVTIAPGPLAGIHMLQNAQEALFDRPVSATAATPDKTVLHGRILLAEDGPDNQRLICLLLGKAGADVTAVENGQLAVEAALAARKAGKPFDVILMDMQMSVMDGYTATQQLRKQGYTSALSTLKPKAGTGTDWPKRPIKSRERPAAMGSTRSRLMLLDSKPPRARPGKNSRFSRRSTNS